MDDPLAPFRSELRAHCYRMLGSHQDAEDVLQEVSVRAWRGREGFEGRSSARTWLHRIAHNACLNELERKERRVLPVDVTRAAAPGAGFAEPEVEVLWLQPLPDDPALGAEQREGVELAFVAAVQHLPANQRAALLLVDVLGFSSAEVAGLMRTTRASVASALQRARGTLDARPAEPTQAAALAALGDAQRELVERYTTALREHDVDGLLAVLSEDATWSMPPLANWYRGRDAIRGFLVKGPVHVQWRHRGTTANGQLAVGCYAFQEDERRFGAYALDVLRVRGDHISEVVSFLDPSCFPAFGLPRSRALGSGVLELAYGL